MKTILDANIIIADYRFNSTDSKILLEASRKKDIDLYVPEIVLDEVYNKFEERLNEAKSKINKETSVIKKLTESKLQENFSSKDINEKVKEYKSYIETLFSSNNITILNYPEISHKIIVNKAIKKRKPFNSAEKGYRDALIWENVKSQMPLIGTNVANPEVIFITNNKKDFCENENNLHKELITEIEDAELDIDSIKVINTLNEFSKEIAQLFFAQANSFKERIKSGEIEDLNFEDLILYKLRETLENADISEIESIPYSASDATVRYIEKVDNVNIIDVRKFSSSEYLIDLTCKVEMTIDFYIDKHDHYSNDEATYDVEDFDWNDYVIWASELVNPDLNISIILDSDLIIVSMQIE